MAARPARSRRRGSTRPSRASPSPPTGVSWPSSAPIIAAQCSRIAGGSPSLIAGLADGEYPLRFTPDGRTLYVWKRDVPAHVYTIDVASGRRELWKDLMPLDPAGIERISNVVVTPDGKSYAYTYSRLLSDLFVVEGLK